MLTGRVRDDSPTTRRRARLRDAFCVTHMDVQPFEISDVPTRARVSESAHEVRSTASVTGMQVG